MNWEILDNSSQLSEVLTSASFKDRYLMFFKHSTRCSISDVAKNRLESSWIELEEKVVPYYLDLIAHRDVSNELSAVANISHESPQVLIFLNGKCIYSASHMQISSREILATIS